MVKLHVPATIARSVANACAPMCIAAASSVSLGTIQVFNDVGQFMAATGATAQPALPNLGLVGRHIASTTVGDLTFSINNQAPEIALILGEFSTLQTGNEIALSDWEALDVTAPFPLHALGSFFIEGTDQPTSCNTLCPCTDTTYQMRLLLGSEVVGQFQFNVSDDVLAFVGVSSTLPFDRVEYRDLSQQCDNEYWGQFFISAAPPSCQGDINSDGQRNTADLVLLLQHFGKNAGPAEPTDLNHDGTVNTTDLVLLLQSFGQPC